MGFHVVKVFGQFPFGFVVAQSSLWLLGWGLWLLGWDLWLMWWGLWLMGWGLWLMGWVCGSWGGQEPRAPASCLCCAQQLLGEEPSPWPVSSQVQSLLPELLFPSCFAV